MVDLVRVKGMQELYQALSQIIPREMEGKVLQKALAAGASITRAAVRAKIGAGGTAPEIRSGTLKRAVYSRRSKFDNTPTFESRVIGIRKGKRAKDDAYYGYWVEYGHKTAPRRNAQSGRYERGVPGKVSRVPPHPFMRPAFDATKDRALAAILSKLQDLLQEAQNKVPKRGF